MRRTSSVALATVAIALLSVAPLAAQHQDPMTRGEGPLRSKGAITIGPVASVDFPVGDFGDVAGTGFTIGGQVTYGLGTIALLGEVTYNTFGGETVDGIELDSFNSVAFDAGLRASLPIGQKVGLYAGAVAGVWTGDIDEFDAVPLLGIQVGPVDIEGRYKGLFGDADWFSVGGALHFRIK